MIDESKMDDIFAQFIRSGSGSDDVRQLYEVMPWLTPSQQRVLVLYRSLAVKYNSPVLHEIADRITEYARSNRKTGFGFSRMLSAWSLYKHFNGLRMTSRGGEDTKL
jgi:hypothetical protein